MHVSIVCPCSYQCLPNITQRATESQIDQCWYRTTRFNIGINLTVYFLEGTTEIICSKNSPQPLEVTKHCEFTVCSLENRDQTSRIPANTNSLCFTVRAKPPVKLSFDNASDGGWRLTWSSPYPFSSSLNKNITYEISYRKDGESDWTVSVKYTDFGH